jgi:copper resistance protein B
MTMRRITLALALIATPAMAQDMPGMDHSAHDMTAAEQAAPAPTEEAIGNAPPPPVPTDHPADAFFPIARMAPARAALAQEGKFFGNALIVDRLEYRAVKGRDGYGWQGEAWIGADLDKLIIASEGEGAWDENPERVELRALWRHAVDPYFNLEAGVRHDFYPSPQRTYATIGIDGLAPYWFDVEGQLLLSDKGDFHARIEGSYDLRLTNRLILQPAVELDAAFQDVPELGIGAGFERIETGARLRYQVTRQFAPYVGVHWERKLGETATRARAAGEAASAVSAVFGVRAWF